MKIPGTRTGLCALLQQFLSAISNDNANKNSDVYMGN